MKIYGFMVVEFKGVLLSGDSLYMPVVQTDVTIDTIPPNGRKTPTWGWKLDKTLFPEVHYTKQELTAALAEIGKGSLADKVFENELGGHYSHADFENIFLIELDSSVPVEDFKGKMIVKSQKNMQNTFTTVNSSGSAFNLGYLLKDADIVTMTFGKDATFYNSQIEMLTTPYHIMAVDAPDGVRYVSDNSTLDCFETRYSKYNAMQVTDEEGIQYLEEITKKHFKGVYEIKTIPGMEREDAIKYLFKNHI